jgi:hypothetical protein
MLPSLVEICKALAGSMGMKEVGVVPVKDAEAALRKTKKKFKGDVIVVWCGDSSSGRSFVTICMSRRSLV